ncbi:hypothetical protein N781_10315 [Pontibacillus halophilus JSM 076056 = DSM 19796]|uniref:Glycosyltransferase RgtA/B/C/D-like domain-containing protein n=1 Tax=Pontibacillus halophilus JSM 076056 = DSM 19796 TaxID=1385510 RepID=A0A0A5IC69_9BACI|nr:hypothetical protein [Pontibacillus halophilus]KGX93437.1 hypothetical protein N781_10315 [Pontibacillus halophilus JSM 076056 = DSM 19796]
MSGSKKVLIVGFCLYVIIGIIRFLNVSAFASSWDIVDFALGIERFDMLDMQPHFPGYPFFILGGMLVHLFIKDLTLSLSVWNTIVSLSTIFPLWWMVRKRASVLYSTLAVLVVHTIPFVQLAFVAPMSEGMALSVVIWLIWSIDRLQAGKHVAHAFLPAIFFALLMGVRVSYLPLGIGLLWVWKWVYKNVGATMLFIHIGVSVSLQFIWVGGLIQSLGGLSSFWFVASQFVEGHFTEWGGSVVTHSLTWWERGYTFLWNNVAWIGFGVTNSLLLVLWVFVIVVALTKAIQLRTMNWMLVFMGGGYLLWAFFAQNIDKARHILPLVLILALGALLVLATQPRRMTAFLLTAVLFIQLPLSTIHMYNQSHQIPATYQLASYVEQLPNASMVYTWEEERTFDYLEIKTPYKKIKTYPLFLEDMSIESHQHVYVTDAVLNGFRQQGYDVEEHVRYVETFTSKALYHPVYHEITLYKWITRPHAE